MQTLAVQWKFFVHAIKYLAYYAIIIYNVKVAHVLILIIIITLKLKNCFENYTQLINCCMVP